MAGRTIGARPVGKRERGRSRKTYLDVIEELGRKRGTTLIQMKATAKYRKKKWKRFVCPFPTL